jgi:hypothetical protein
MGLLGICSRTSLQLDHSEPGQFHCNYPDIIGYREREATRKVLVVQAGR